jgi:hypothetical protein
MRPEVVGCHLPGQGYRFVANTRPQDAVCTPAFAPRGLVLAMKTSLPIMGCAPGYAGSEVAVKRIA